MSTTVDQDSKEVNEILAKSFGELKSYNKKYSNSSKGIIIVAIIVLIFGLSLFFQMCSGVASGCAPIGFLGSSVTQSGTVDGKCDDDSTDDVCEDYATPYISNNLFGFIEVLSLLMITGSLSVLVAYYVNASNAETLAESGDVMGAMVINSSEAAFKDKAAADNMLKNQLNVYTDKYRSETGSIRGVEMIQLLNRESINSPQSVDNSVPALNSNKNENVETSSQKRGDSSGFPGSANNFNPGNLPGNPEEFPASP